VQNEFEFIELAFVDESQFITGLGTPALHAKQYPSLSTCLISHFTIPDSSSISNEIRKLRKTPDYVSFPSNLVAQRWKSKSTKRPGNPNGPIASKAFS
jgi:hypothetical protein